MRFPITILAVIGLGAVVATSGSALTASTSVASGVAGYGQTTSTGAVISAFSEATVAGDASRLASVTFTSTTNVTGKTARLALTSGNTLVGGPYTCTLGTYALGSMTITCPTSDSPLLNTFNTRGLSIL